MTRPTLLRLAPLDIPVDFGMAKANAATDLAPAYRFGLDTHGTLYLTFQFGLPWIGGSRPRVSVEDPHWHPNHAMRYVEWVTTL